ncbi:type II secretion system protein J [Actinoplanes sp. NPDC020271]|uniref:type II secretion system protein J n=1 Tax=Actinoplanes sp. NPDC020271 TaxID=3363896 RepID=UPI00378C9EB4
MPPGKRRDDQGFSLMELLVTTGIMSVVTLVAVTAIIQIYSGTKQIEQNSVTGDQLDISFNRLDRELRYATYVSPVRSPAGVTTRYYLEFATPPRVKTATDLTDPPVRCRQLLFDTDKKILTMRNWNLGGTPDAASTLATDVALDGTAKPFEVYLPGDAPWKTASAGTTGVGTQFTAKYLMVRVHFKVTSGDVTQRFDSDFTTQNIGEANDLDGKDDDPDKIDPTLQQCSNVGRP